MKITAMQEYGLRCILQLAARKPSTSHMTVREIAKQEHLTPVYVAKILVTLRRGGLVKSIRGVNGGYALSRPPREISAARVLAVLGKVDLGKNLCKRFPGMSSHCTHSGDCRIRPLWYVLTQYIYNFLDRLTLDQLIQEEAGVSREIRRLQNQNPLPAPKTPALV
ncbi:MAG TPA: Rrf2 family transcriptional regulator [Elusimicrobiota bacterium]|nr:Rrf2 family transcriptional regulator [Elusimicrobiota bacterium]